MRPLQQTPPQHGCACPDDRRVLAMQVYSIQGLGLDRTTEMAASIGLQGFTSEGAVNPGRATQQEGMEKVCHK